MARPLDPASARPFGPESRRPRPSQRAAARHRACRPRATHRKTAAHPRPPPARRHHPAHQSPIPPPAAAAFTGPLPLAEAGAQRRLPSLSRSRADPRRRTRVGASPKPAAAECLGPRAAESKRAPSPRLRRGGHSEFRRRRGRLPGRRRRRRRPVRAVVLRRCEYRRRHCRQAPLPWLQLLAGDRRRRRRRRERRGEAPVSRRGRRRHRVRDETRLPPPPRPDCVPHGVSRLDRPGGQQ